MFEKDLPSLNKPAFAEKIALTLKEDIHTNKQRKKTLPEVEVEKIVNMVTRKNSEPS